MNYKNQRNLTVNLVDRLKKENIPFNDFFRITFK